MVFILGASSLFHAINSIPKGNQKRYKSTVFSLPGLSLNPFAVNERKTVQYQLDNDFRHKTDVIIWHDAMGIERFIARRGMPLVIFSDNGTNFVGTEKELLLCFLNLDKQKIASELAQKGVKWKFNPPAAPHHGGVWERLVRSFKRTLYAILGNRRLTDEILLTTFCLVEQSLNNRPLTSVSSDANNLDALTPNHFLLGNRSACLPSLTPVDDFNHRKRYARAQAYANALWKRWLKEYLPPLNRRCKWKTPSDEILKTGDLVWIIDSDSPRDYYPLARILSLRYGNDGIARSAQVQTKSGSLIRPIVNLIPVFESSVLGPEDNADAIACKRK